MVELKSKYGYFPMAIFLGLIDLPQQNPKLVTDRKSTKDAMIFPTENNIKI